MNDTQVKLLVRTATVAFSLALAIGVNLAAAYSMGGSGTPNGRARHMVVADLGTLPAITIHACRANG